MKVNLSKKHSLRRPGKLPIIAGAVLVLLLAAAAAVFFSRAPVLILTDTPFTMLYGPRRVLLRRIETSLRLFRMVKPLTAADTSGDDTVALILEAAGDAYCILAPNRFSGGVRRYFQAHPDARIALIGARPAPHGENDGIFYIGTDEAADLYRSGRAAAMLAGEGEGKTLFFYGRMPDAAARDALRQGLSDGGRPDSLVMVSSSAAFEAFDGAGCIILRAAAPEVLNRALPTPVIIFSWLDPGLMSRANCVIFDDSCWARVLDAAAMMTRPGVPVRTALLPSDMIVVKKHLPPGLPPEDLFKLRKIGYTKDGAETK